MRSTSRASDAMSRLRRGSRPRCSSHCDVFVTGNKGVLAVDALAGPVGHPVGRIAQELRRTECVGKQDEQLALVGLLP